MPKSRHQIAAVALCLVPAVAFLAGCSSSGSSNASQGGSAASPRSAACVQAATAAAAKASAVPELPLPAKISTGALAGKLIVAIPQSTAIPDDAAWGNAIKAAAAAAGARITVINGEGTTTGAARAIQQAISLDPAAVTTYGVITADIGGAISALNAARIPLVPYAPGVPGSSKYLVDQDWGAVGTLMADYALAQTKCKLDAVLFTAKAFSGVTAATNAVTAEVSRLCPACTVRPIDVDVANMVTTLQPAVQGAIERDPKLNFIIAGFDGMAPLIVPAVQQANSKVSLISEHGTIQNLDYVKSGTVQTGDVESVSVAEQAWICMDQSLRAAAGAAPGPGYNKTPLFLVTSNDVTSAIKFLDSDSYVAQFKSLWGV